MSDRSNVVVSTSQLSIRSVSELMRLDETNGNAICIKAETIEVVPEIIPFTDDTEDDDYNEYDEDDIDDNTDATNFDQHIYGFNDNDEEEFDEYGYQVRWSNNGTENILYDDDNDNVEIRQMDTTDNDYDEDDVDDDDINENSDDVILIESDDECSGGSQSINDSGGGLNADGSIGDSGERKMYECDICFRKVASSYNLKRHMMIHTGEKPYGCDICNRRFREFSDLKKHRRVHSTEKQFKCMICQRNPPSATNSTKCISCEHKEAARKSQDLAMEQIIPRYDGNKKAFICNYCDRIFGSSSNLKRHIMIHTGEKPFTCGICQRSFREMSTLKKHSFTHRNDMNAQQTVIASKSLKCYVCLKTFTDSNVFKKHILFHSNSKANLAEITIKPIQPSNKIYHHKCPKCNDIFYDSSKLMLHICSVHKPNDTSTFVSRKSATSPPPLIPIRRTSNFTKLIHSSYVCAICSKRFRSQQHLISHRLTHNN